MRETLGDSGKAIWDAYGASGLNAAHRTLVLEFARCADTADRLADLAAGRREVWVSLAFDDMGEIHVSVDKILDQVRATQNTLKTLHGEIRQAGIAIQAANAPRKDEEPQDMLAMLRQRKEERERQSG